MDDLTALRRARDLISDPARWTQGKFARDVAGVSVSPSSKDAVCWCALGALRKVTCNKLATFDLALKLSPVNSVANFNDDHTHSDVLALFDAAIARKSAR